MRSSLSSHQPEVCLTQDVSTDHWILPHLYGVRTGLRGPRIRIRVVAHQLLYISWLQHPRSTIMSTSVLVRVGAASQAKHDSEEINELQSRGNDDDDQVADRRQTSTNELRPPPALPGQTKDGHKAGEEEQAVTGEGDRLDEQVGSGQFSGL